MKKTQDFLQCPSCFSSCKSLYNYSCCFQFGCQNCVNHSHFNICQFTNPLAQFSMNQIFGEGKNINCRRCEQSMASKLVQYCQQCRTNYCHNCYQELHQKNKFLMHQKIKLEQQSHQKLVCKVHSKTRNLFCQQYGMICSNCANGMKNNRTRHLCCLDIKKVREQCQALYFNISLRRKNQAARFEQLQLILQNSYKKILDELEERFHSNLSGLRKVKTNFMSSISTLMEKTEKLSKQLSVLEQLKSLIQEPITTRSFIISEFMKKIKKQIGLLNLPQYKVFYPDQELREAFCKKFVFMKTKLKIDDEEKENKSLRKSRVQSVSKSVNRSELKRQNSSRTILKNMTNSGYHPIKNQMINSVTKITHNIRETSQNIKNVPCIALDFTNRDPVLLQQKEDSMKKDNEMSFGYINSEMKNKSKPNYLKRKSDYLDMRDRMRKPTLTNRFQIS